MTFLPPALRRSQQPPQVPRHPVTFWAGTELGLLLGAIAGVITGAVGTFYLLRDWLEQQYLAGQAQEKVSGDG